MDIQDIKQRFGIIGNSPLINRAIDIARQVAPTDITVLITGESGSGKEVFSHIIHQISARKHGPFIAVNCGAIPEGTIDSELFGHEKGSFTGATGSRQGYFEVANGGTIFLDEVAELPMQTQVRLLRVLETGEFIRVGSSKVIKTNVRVVAATNENMHRAIQSGKFREDLLYRLSTVPISLPPLRQRQEDIHLLFRKFAADFADKYRMPAIRLQQDAIEVLTAYNWPGNIRQLKNLVEQLSVIEQNRELNAVQLIPYIPAAPEQFPSVVGTQESRIDEREIMYKFLFDMKSDLNDLKKLVVELLNQQGEFNLSNDQLATVNRIYSDINVGEQRILPPVASKPVENVVNFPNTENETEEFEIHEEVQESLSLESREKELIQKALDKHRGRRKYAAEELGISERTLYRKIKEYAIPG
jgi:transcriptional regulator with PAS, ATPase and Fis domain